jgi:hypothetical protein
MIYKRRHTLFKQPPAFSPVPQENIPQAILISKDPDETVYWVGRPENLFAFYMDSKIWIVPIATLFFWAILDFNYWVFAIGATFLCVRIFLTNMLMKNIYYAATDRRIIISGKMISKNVTSFDYDQISSVSAHARWFERISGVGSIYIAGSGGRSWILMVKDYEQICGFIKETMVNIKTDWNYPNDLWPPGNRGFKTKYNKTI